VETDDEKEVIKREYPISNNECRSNGQRTFSNDQIKLFQTTGNTKQHLNVDHLNCDIVSDFDICDSYLF